MKTTQTIQTMMWATSAALILASPAAAQQTESAGDAAAAEGEAPGAAIPTGDTPEGEAPATETPEGETPEGETPEGEIPTGETPEGETPEGETPEGETPEGETPEGETPEGESGEAATTDSDAIVTEAPGDTGPDETVDDDDDWGDVEEVSEGAMDDYTEEDTWYGEAYPAFDRHFNLMTARAARPFSIMFIIHHRTGSAIQTAPFEDWLGFDRGSLKVGLGLRYGIIEGLDVGLTRLNGTVEKFDTYEFDARYQFLNQQDHFVDLAVRAGLSWFAPSDCRPDDRCDHALKPFGQILVNHVLFNRVLMTANLMVHGDSSGPEKAATDRNWSLGGGIGVDVRILNWLAWGSELSFGFAGYSAEFPAFSTGPKFITNRHTFAIVLTNSQYVLADGVVASTPRDFTELILGFTITREWNL